MTAEFDPLRDEGVAYAEALAAAGVPVEQLQARGHIHSSFTMVDVIATAVGGREKMAQALQRFAGLEEPGVLPKTAELHASKTGVDWRPIVDIGASEREAHRAVARLVSCYWGPWSKEFWERGDEGLRHLRASKPWRAEKRDPQYNLVSSALNSFGVPLDDFLSGSGP